MHRNNDVKSDSGLLASVDFVPVIAGEKIPENGEDSYVYGFTPYCGIFGVFDGCGGSGAKTYENFSGKTGAYMAARTVAGTVMEWFGEYSKGACGTQGLEILNRKILEHLKLCREVGGGTGAIKGTLSREFPTTAAITLLNPSAEGINATCIWAGDSRCYLLDADGLKQLTEDDLDSLDAMENLTADGVLTNVISASKDFKLHCKTYKVSKPAMLFAATDGCFGYFSTPMEFEYVILYSLLAATSVEDWENGLNSILGKVSGDDYSLTGAVIGFGSLDRMKKELEQRCFGLYEDYIRGIETRTREEKNALWNKYKQSYYICGGSVQPVEDREPVQQEQPEKTAGTDGEVINAPQCVNEKKPDIANEAGSEKPKGFTVPNDFD